jgi:hypothetical protein
MSAPIPPITANPNTNIDIEDSCNCCWGRKVSKKPAFNRSNASLYLFAKELENPPRDANEVYNLKVTVNVETPNNSRRAMHESYDADSTQSTKEENV